MAASISTGILIGFSLIFLLPGVAAFTVEVDPLATPLPPSHLGDAAKVTATATLTINCGELSYYGEATADLEFTLAYIAGPNRTLTGPDSLIVSRGNCLQVVDDGSSIAKDFEVKIGSVGNVWAGQIYTSEVHAEINDQPGPWGPLYVRPEQANEATLDSQVAGAGSIQAGDIRGPFALENGLEWRMNITSDGNGVRPISVELVDSSHKESRTTLKTGQVILGPAWRPDSQFEITWLLPEFRDEPEIGTNWTYELVAGPIGDDGLGEVIMPFVITYEGGFVPADGRENVIDRVESPGVGSPFILMGLLAAFLVIGRRASS